MAEKATTSRAYRPPSDTMLAASPPLAKKASPSPTLSSRVDNTSMTSMNANPISPASGGSLSSSFNRGQIVNHASPDMHHGDLLWRSISASVLTLYNGEGVKGNLEDINESVRQWAIEASAQTVLDDIERLFRGGVSILSTKLVSTSEETLSLRVVEIWTFYFGTVLPYLQAVFLPVRGILKVRLLDSKCATTASTGTTNLSFDNVGDIRTMALMAFRDVIVQAHIHRLEDAFLRLFKPAEASDPRRVKDIGSRGLQMFSILAALPASEEKQRVLNKTMHEMQRLIRGRMLGNGMLASPAPMSGAVPQL